MLEKQTQNVPNVSDITCRPDRFESWLNRADVEAEMQRWDKAAADYEKVLDLGIHHWRKPALAWLDARQPERYRNVCARFSKADKRRDVEAYPHEWAWVYVLAPAAVADLKPVVNHLEKWLKGAPADPEQLLAMGAVY